MFSGHDPAADANPGNLNETHPILTGCSVRRSARLRGTWNCRQPAKGGHMAEQDRADGVVVVGGVDTHRDTHVGAVVDTAGRLLGSAQFRTDPGGYAQLVAWMGSWGRVSRVGVEGTGSYAAGLARYLTAADIEVVEVNRPNRQLRRRRGKDDTTDAEAAARAALSGEATAVPTSGDGPVEWIRMLTLTRRSAVKARTQAANQIHSVLVSAPESLKAQLRGEVDPLWRGNSTPGIGRAWACPTSPCRCRCFRSGRSVARYPTRPSRTIRPQPVSVGNISCRSKMLMPSRWALPGDLWLALVVLTKEHSRRSNNHFIKSSLYSP